MTVAQMDAYILSVDGLEQSVLDDSLYPKIGNSKCKALCFIISELVKEGIRYFKISRCNNGNATQENKTQTNKDD